VLRLEWLEARELPAVTIQIDYSYDTGFFKNNADARAVIERVAAELGNSLNADLAAITPGGADHWTATFYNPATGNEVSVADPTIPANTLRVYVGGRAIPGPEGGFGGAGGYVLSGSAAFNANTLSRGYTGYAPWGGAITFDSTENWHFGQTTSGLTGTNKIDLYTVATHEMGHLLGIGASSQWTANVSGSTFAGAASRSVYGGAVPLSPDRAHWADGVTIGGAATVMDPNLPRGTRVTWTSLDAAALKDVGWGVAVSPPAAVSPPPPPVVPPAVSPPVPTPPAAPPPPVVSKPVVSNPPTVAFGGGADGTLVVYRSSGGTLTPTGQRFTPFPGYRGELRLAGGDFNGDGVTDYAVATGPGVAGFVAVLNGQDGSFLLAPTAPYGAYSGGLYVAAGDVDRDGRADLITAPGADTAPVVRVARVTGGTTQTFATFNAFDAPGWRGGVRVASGDIDGDGYADVVITTGSQVAAVSIISGKSLASGTRTRLVGDFFPYGVLPVGINAAVGDLDGDGKADLALGLEKGGLPFVAVLSGAALSRGDTRGVLGAFLALPPDTAGVKVAVRDLDGDGKAELVAAGGTTVGVARAFTFSQVQAGGAGAMTFLPPLVGGASGITVG
jgi:hypothetical protein